MPGVGVGIFLGAGNGGLWPSPVAMGDIINDSFSPQVGTYSTFGTGTLNITSGNLALGGGDGTFANGIVMTNYNYDADQLQLVSTFAATNTGAGQYLPLHWLKSSNLVQQNTIAWGVYDSIGAGGSFHFVVFCTQYNGVLGLAYSSSAFSYNSANIGIRTVADFGKDSVTFTWTNLSGGSDTTTINWGYTYPFLSTDKIKHNSVEFALTAPTATVNFSNITISSSGYKNASLAFIGDSISHGYNQVSGAQRFTDIWTQSTGKSSMVFAGGADGTQDILDCMDQILLFNPQRVHLLIGANDAITDYAGFQTRYPQIVSALEGNGTQVIIGLLLPQNANNVTTANTWLNSTFGSGRIVVDCYTLLKAAVGTGYDPAYSDDGLHPNAAGAAIMAAHIESLVN